MKEELRNILSICDHTLLRPEATWDEIRGLLDEAVEFETASVCIPLCYVKRAAEYLKGRIKVCTVIGFPHGNVTTAAKVFEAEEALKDGADEVDMVINIGMLKAGEYDKVRDEIAAVKQACGEKILKVIIEACLLSDDEKIRMCEMITEAGADYIKTSTGFSTGGATFEDIVLFKKHIGPAVKMKAAGGISTLDDAKRFIELGVSRIGTSRIVKIAKEMR